MSFCESKNLIIEMIGIDNFKKAYQYHKSYPSPASNFCNTSWFRQSKIIGINPRITGTFWGIVKYALTFPENAIHLMPFFETGHAGSLYVQNNWRINKEFFDSDLAEEGFDTCEKQLKVVVNILHAIGKTVGFDVLPHTDNFSEIVLTNPDLFEWVKLNNEKTSQLYPPEIDYNTIYQEIQNEIIKFIEQKGIAQSFSGNEISIKSLFVSDISEELRSNIIFGKTLEEREKRRKNLIKHLRNVGFETISVAEHAPCRPIVFDKIETDGVNDWAVFKVKSMSKDAKIIGCITPYKWYSLNKKGYPIISKPNHKVWQYFIDKYTQIQKEYNFDFFRADMAHNQISHSHQGNKSNPYRKIEFWTSLKRKIQIKVPYFATFAEAFYNYYYIDGYRDMMNKDFDVVLGNLNYKYLNEDYINHLKDFITLYDKHFTFKPCICSFTNDGDKEENNDLYQSPLANEVRIFTSLFINCPSYMGIGFETRNLKPQEYEEYTSNYIKQVAKPYKWGKNQDLFSGINEMRSIYLELKKIINEQKLYWLATNNNLSMAWIYCHNDTQKPLYLFTVNLNSDTSAFYIRIIDKDKLFLKNRKILLNGFFSNIYEDFTDERILFSSSAPLIFENQPLGSCSIYKFE